MPTIEIDDGALKRLDYYVRGEYSKYESYSELLKELLPEPGTGVTDLDEATFHEEIEAELERLAATEAFTEDLEEGVDDGDQLVGIIAGTTDVEE
jgi:hypothetical protein